MTVEIGDVLATLQMKSREIKRLRAKRSATSTTDHEPQREKREERIENKDERSERGKRTRKSRWVNKKPFFILQYNYCVLSKMRVHCSKIVNFIAYTSFDGEGFVGV